MCVEIERRCLKSSLVSLVAALFFVRYGKKFSAKYARKSRFGSMKKRNLSRLRTSAKNFCHRLSIIDVCDGRFYSYVGCAPYMLWLWTLRGGGMAEVFKETSIAWAVKFARPWLLASLYNRFQTIDYMAVLKSCS